MQEPEKDSSLDEIKKKLYSTHFKPIHNRAKLSNKKYDLDNDWNPNNNNGEVEPEKPSQNYKLNTPDQRIGKPKSKIFMFVIMFAMIFFVGAMGYAYYVFTANNSTVAGNDVEVGISGPVSIGGGESLALDVIIQNKNSVAMELVDLVISYPEGTKEAGDLLTDLKVKRISIGDIDPGSIVRENVVAALFGQENTTQNINVSIQYRLQGANAVFEKTKPFDIVLSASPVRLVVEGLREISSGQEMELRAILSSNSNKTLENIMVSARYPFGFTFSESNINPIGNNDTWLFTQLGPEEEKEIIIKGTIEGQNDEDRVFRFNTGIKSKDNNELGIVWGEILHETKIQKTFVDLNIAINNSNSEQIIIEGGGRVAGIMNFVNSTEDILRDLQIEIKLEGDIFEERSVSVEKGFYNSINNVITWNSETSDIFSELKPRDNYRMSFSFDLLDFVDGDNLIDNPELALQAVVQAIRTSDDNAETKINTNTFTTLKVITDVPVEIYTAYNDGPFTDTGTIAPKAEQQTTYTIGLEVSNSLNNLENVKLEGTLPSYVSWRDLYLPQAEFVSYDDATRRVVWDIGKINSRTGYITPPRRMFLNLALTPSISQIGRNPILINDLKITGYDTFADTNFVSDLKSPDITIHNRSISDRHNAVTE